VSSIANTIKYKFVTGETLVEMIEWYFREQSLLNLSNFSDEDFSDQIDQRRINMNQLFKATERGRKRRGNERDVRRNAYIESYRFSQKIGFDDAENKVDYRKLQEWSKTVSIPLPKTLEEYMKKQVSRQASHHKKGKAR